MQHKEKTTIVSAIAIIITFAVSQPAILNAQHLINHQTLSDGIESLPNITDSIPKRNLNINEYVNLTAGYSKEPAPMGIAEYGISPGGPYIY